MTSLITEGLIADIAAVLVIALCVIFKSKQGLYKSMIPLLSFVCAVAGAWILANVLAGPVSDAVAPKIAEKFTEVTGMIGKTAADSSPLAGIDLPMFRKFAESSGGFFERLVLYFGQLLSKGVEAAVTAAVKLLIFVVSFIVLKIVFRIAFSGLGFVSKLPFVKWVDRFGGAVLGLGLGLIVVWVICIGVQISGAADLSKMAGSSYLLKYFI